MKEKPFDRYQRKINENINYLNSLEDIKRDFTKSAYSDPDCIIDVAEVEGISINLASDGLCGIEKIITYSSNDKIIENYKLIRNEYLLWPAYAMSINQQRGFKNTFDDRIDLLMTDLDLFYEAMNSNNAYSTKLIRDIQKQCKLYRAYLNMFTFSWLCKFKDFNQFINENNYGKYVTRKGGKAVPENWTNTNTFDEAYFTILLEKCKS